MRWLALILATLLSAGCSTHFKITETASGSLENPTVTRTTESSTSVPWRDPIVPKSQGNLTARPGKVTTGETDWFDPIAVGSGLHPLYIMGGLTILAGVAIAIFLKDWMNGALVAAAGAGMIALVFVIETYPWVMLLAFMAVAGVCGWLVYQAYVKRRATKTVEKTVSGIDKFKQDEPVAWTKLKPYLSSAHDKTTEAQVRKVRSKLPASSKPKAAPPAEKAPTGALFSRS